MLIWEKQERRKWGIKLFFIWINIIYEDEG